MYIISPTEDVTISPCLVKTFKQGHGKEAANLNELNHPFPRRLSILHDTFIPNAVLDRSVIVLNLSTSTRYSRSRLIVLSQNAALSGAHVNR
jgi:hypothetical protein